MYEVTAVSDSSAKPGVQPSKLLEHLWWSWLCAVTAQHEESMLRTLVTSGTRVIQSSCAMRICCKLHESNITPMDHAYVYGLNSILSTGSKCTRVQGFASSLGVWVL